MPGHGVFHLPPPARAVEAKIGVVESEPGGRDGERDSPGPVGRRPQGGCERDGARGHRHPGEGARADPPRAQLAALRPSRHARGDPGGHRGCGDRRGEDDRRHAPRHVRGAAGHGPGAPHLRRGRAHGAEDARRHRQDVLRFRVQDGARILAQARGRFSEHRRPGRRRGEHAGAAGAARGAARRAEEPAPRPASRLR